MAYERIAAGLRGHAVLERAQNWTILGRLLANEPPSIVVLGIGVDALFRTERALRELRHSGAVAHLVLLCPPDPAAVDTLYRLPGSPADAFIMPGVHDLATIRQRILARPVRSVAVVRLRRLFADRLVAPLATMLDWCLSQVDEANCGNFSVAGMAADAGWSRTTVDRHFDDSCHSTPSDFIAWVRVLLAVQLMVIRPQALAVVADQVGLSSASALGRLVKKQTGLTVGGILERDAVAFVERKFIDVFGTKSEVRSILSSNIEWPLAVTTQVQGSDDVASTP